ncbi:uncharacterized transmembrane protein DDB_G0289901 [Punica granatum]|uniref:Uncharacterized protein n=2 Tax=Punica granatum TaxID=22663 RepID=A0A2I0KB95_PUNGR|nr:uncharacterized transmembrane protein DDB_G0289901 [Punica granatum]PKI65046.1 hypothetical protein CRG98_014515 [Punica granatum]
MNSNFDFDLGIGSNKSRSLNDQKNKPAPYSYTSGSAAQQPKPAWQPNKPSWTHQPAPTQPSRGNAASLNGPTSMVGDIFGKSWGSTSGPSGSGIGVVEKSPNLFGDLVSSALGGKSNSNSNAPLKNAPPVSGNKNAYAMGNLSDSLPKPAPNSANSGGSWGSNGNFGCSTSAYKSNTGVNLNGSSAAKSANIGGPSMKSMSGASSGMNLNKDPFSSLGGFGGTKQEGGNLNSSKAGAKASSGNGSFGDFQNAAKSSTASAFRSSGFTANNNGSFPTPNLSSNSKMDDFGINFSSPSQAPQAAAQSSNVDQFDSLFSSSSASGGGGATASEGFGGEQMEDDWGFGGGNDSGGATTELEGLPPPPAGVSASSAKNKGLDNYKQGQYADAIKWLSWAEVLLAKTGDDAAEVLTCRASCYKEVGEYKKAVADCTKVLEHDESNVVVLVQRALLYESMEKYRLGAEDLRTVLKIDPANRIARSTIHRLNKLAD